MHTLGDLHPSRGRHWRLQSRLEIRLNVRASIGNGGRPSCPPLLPSAPHVLLRRLRRPRLVIAASAWPPASALERPVPARQSKLRRRPRPSTPRRGLARFVYSFRALISFHPPGNGLAISDCSRHFRPPRATCTTVRGPRRPMRPARVDLSVRRAYSYEWVSLLLPALPIW
jgi:hypothetical protein